MPRMRSLPPRPRMTSSPGVPTMMSLPDVPTIVAVLPPQVPGSVVAVTVVEELELDDEDELLDDELLEDELLLDDELLDDEEELLDVPPLKEIGASCTPLTLFSEATTRQE